MVNREIKALAVGTATYYGVGCRTGQVLNQQKGTATYYGVGETVYDVEITEIKHLPNINTFEIYSHEDLIIEVVADRYTVFYI